MTIKKATCPLCCVNSSDILLHLIMSWAIYFPQRLKLTDEQFSIINLFLGINVSWTKISRKENISYFTRVYTCIPKYQTWTTRVGQTGLYGYTEGNMSIMLRQFERYFIALNYVMSCVTHRKKQTTLHNYIMCAMHNIEYTNEGMNEWLFISSIGMNIYKAKSNIKTKQHIYITAIIINKIYILINRSIQILLNKNNIHKMYIVTFTT
jgi:hypothetical protein